MKETRPQENPLDYTVFVARAKDLKENQVKRNYSKAIAIMV